MATSEEHYEKHLARYYSWLLDDILNFASHCPESVELCVCMGDTLTHLDSFEKVKSLFADVYNSLEAGGKFVLTFRDLVPELKDVDRLIPVKSDPETIFTCLLEYETEHVKVSDMIYTKRRDKWKLDVSCYRKLRIPIEWVRMELSGLVLLLVFVKTIKA